MKLGWVYDDGGRAAANLSDGPMGDCVTRAIAIAAQLDYRTVWEAMAAFAQPDKGIAINEFFFLTSMADYGFRYHHLTDIKGKPMGKLDLNTIPRRGRFVAVLNNHAVAVVNGIMRDTYDPSNGGKRAVYGYYKRA